jgi:hypothetical protein
MSDKQLKKNLWFAYLSVLLCWSLQAYFLLVQYFEEGTLLARIENGRPYICDFVNFYSMAYLANRSMHEHVEFYDPSVQAETAKIFTAPIVAELPFTFQSPPWFFPLLMPLSFLPITEAFWVWDCLAAILIGAAVFVLAFPFHKSAFARIFVLAAVFASYPTWLCFRLGQTAWFNFAAFTAFWCLIGLQRSFLAGLAAGILTIKFQYLPLPLVVGLMLGRLRFILGFSLVAAQLFVLALVTVGWSNIACYPQALLSLDAGKNISGVSPELMQNLRGALVLLTDADNQLVHIVAIAFLLLVVISGAAIFFWQARNEVALDRDFKIKASICSLLVLIASPHTHIQDYLVATIPALWLWEVASNFSAPTLKALILSFPVLSWIFFILRPVFMLFRLQPFFIWALLVIFFAAKLQKLSEKCTARGSDSSSI